MAKIILGFTGEMACGKGTAAKYVVQKYGAKSFRFSTILRDVLDRLCLEQSRANMQRISTILRQNFGDDLLAGAMAEDVKKDTADIIVIDGVRRRADTRYLKEIPEFKLAYIETDIKVCHDRIVKRGENSDDAAKTFDQFQRDHEGEADRQIKDLKKCADFLINNDGSLEYLYKQIDKIINEK